MFVKAAQDRMVRDPRSKMQIPPEGVEVRDDDSYWIRRIADGDVVVVEKPATAPVAKEKE